MCILVSNSKFNLFEKRDLKKVISSIYRAKSSQTSINFEGIKCAPELKRDTIDISKNSLPIYSSTEICISHKSEGGICVFSEHLPKGYIRRTKYGDYEYTPNYKLDKLWVKEKGQGTSNVQSVVLKSLKDDTTCGRVTLDACCLDGETAPGAFYYKLGFRFNNQILNEKCERWLKSGGKYQDAPFCVGSMYLPKENIEHCLKYGNEEYYYKYILPEYEEKIKRALS